VSALGRNYDIVLQGHLLAFGSGTSAATPVFAGTLALLNAARFAEGLPFVGFANPLLYSIASAPGAFYDITVGSNNCAAFTCCADGYYTASGWDAVTGLGSVGDYNALQSAALSI
jgi:tripeptidyl-peptidase I